MSTESTSPRFHPRQTAPSTRQVTSIAQEPAPSAAAVRSIPLARRLLAEFLGTAALLMIVVGSGIAAQRLSDDVGLQLFENSTATALGLGVLIVVLGPVSGAHFNPVVTAVDWLAALGTGTGTRARDIAPYALAQVAGGIGGTIVAGVMFAAPIAIGTNERANGATFVAEVVATAGLVAVIFVLLRTGHRGAIAPAVGAYIGAAYWFTSSTAFANPAVTIARMFTDTFAGIAPESVLPFIGAQIIGGALGYAVIVLLVPRRAASPDEAPAPGAPGDAPHAVAASVPEPATPVAARPDPTASKGHPE